MEGSSNALLSASARIQDYEYLYASNTNASNFVSVKLSGNGNYVLWKAQMFCLLDRIGMRGIVDTSHATSVGELSEHDMDIMRKYDRLVKGWIMGSVSEDVLVDIYNLDSAKDVWEKLKSIYEPNMCLQEDSIRERADPKTDVEDRDAIVAETNTTEKGANSMETIVKVNTETNQNQMKHKNYFDEILQYKKFREVVRDGDWSKLNNRLLNEAISNDGSTILHSAVGMHANDIVKVLILLLTDQEVLKTRDDGSTALHVAAIVGNTHAAKLHCISVECYEGLWHN